MTGSVGENRRAPRNSKCPRFAMLAQLFSVSDHAFGSNPLQCAHAIFGAPEFSDAAHAYGLGHGYIRAVVTNSEDEDSAVLTLSRVSYRCSGVRQGHRIGEAAREDWQQHSDQQCSPVHDGHPCGYCLFSRLIFSLPGVKTPFQPMRISL